MFTAFLGAQLSQVLPKLEITKCFENVPGGRRTYVFAKSDRMKIILDDQEKYIAVFLVADDSVGALVFNTALISESKRQIGLLTPKALGAR